MTSPVHAKTRRTLRSVQHLAAAGFIAPADVAGLDAVAQRYAVAVTPEMADAIGGAVASVDPADPMARQFIPSLAELVTTPDERADPIGDHAHMPVEGVVHRYPDRVLLKVVHACPVYCRFCFRREMVGPGGKSLTGTALDNAIAYVAMHPEIFEVIVTGGDPFVLAPRKLAELTRRVARIPHVKVIRWHTRVPVVSPERITDACVTALRSRDVAVYVGVHANHPREFTPNARAAIARLSDAGISLVSQSVLLRGINDDVETLAELMRCFVANSIKPYYLHHPDLAPGTSHFRLSIAEGQALMKTLRGRLSGLCQPTYVLDIPGGAGKSPVGPTYVSEDGREIEDFKGGRHRL